MKDVGRVQNLVKHWDKSQVNSSRNRESSTETHKSINNTLKDSAKNAMPWKDKWFGFIPHPKTARATFLNDNVLPQFYDSKWTWCKNAEQFVIQFHSEGRRQYDMHQKIQALQESHQFISDEKSQGGAGFLLTEDHVLKPHDSQSITFKTRKLKEMQKKVENLERSIHSEDKKLFLTNGNLRTGETCAHKFNKQCITTLTNLKKDIDCTMAKLQALDEKHRSMYPNFRKGAVSKKRKQKENRAKSKKRKLQREDANCRRVFSFVAPTNDYSSKADVSDLSLLNISKMGKRDANGYKS